MSKVYVPREIEPLLKKYLSTPEILIVLGPRQSGKSTLLRHIAADLQDSSFISFEDVDILALFEADIKGFYKLHVEPFRYVIIDEIQYAANFGRNMKYLYDQANGQVKFLVTGSSVTEFYLQGLKFLVGRALTFHLYPFSFKEFLWYRNKDLIPLVGREALQSRIQKYLTEFVLYGGYPRVVLSEDVQEKKLILKNLYNLLIQREIVSLAGLLNYQKVIKLIRLLTVHSGSLLNFSTLSKEIGLTIEEVKRLLFLFRSTFVVETVEPFFTNKKLEIIKNPKLYFLDNGLYNAILNNFSELRPDMGVLYETFVFQELLKQDLAVNFWRTKAKTEVDFVLQTDGRLIPIEVKMRDASLTRSFRSFLQKYRPAEGYLFNLSEHSELQVETSRVYKRFLPEIIHFKEIAAI